MFKLALAATAALSFVLGAGFEANAQSKCTAAKAKATGKKAAAKLVCASKSIAKGTSLDAECLAKAEEKFSNAFGKAEAKTYTLPDIGCITTDDVVEIEAMVDAFLDEVLFTLTASTCPARGAGEVGGPCDASPDCDSTSGAGDGVCYVGSTGPPDGYCTIDDGSGTACLVDADCGTGNACVDLVDFAPYRFCVPACGECGGTTCSEGQACFDTFNGLRLDKTACVPGDDSAEDGDACGGFFECNDLSSCTSDIEFPGGVCARNGCTVGDDSTCHGGHCVDVTGETPLTGTTCVDTCTSNSDCRAAEGYVCFDGGANPDYCRHPHVGDACVGAEDCGGGAWLCLTGAGFAGGYCTQEGCTNAGAACSNGSVCFDPLAGPNFCIDRCDPAEVGSQGRCRSGYVCTDADPGTAVTPGCVPP
jgi:hypothetical protein